MTSKGRYKVDSVLEAEVLEVRFELETEVWGSGI